MRARRHFQPSFDSLPMRFAPTGLVTSAMNPLAGLGKPQAITCPWDPASGHVSSPPASDPATTSGAGSYSSPSTATILT